MPSVVALDRLIDARRVWRGQVVSSPSGANFSTGHHFLDAVLPGGGWPKAALSEILTTAPGIGELSLLWPTLASLTISAAIGFLALAKKYETALDAGQILAPAKDLGQMQNVIMNAYTNATLSVLFLVVVFSILFYAIKVGRAAWIRSERTDKETPYQVMPDA